jgi:hypothetical protein
LKLGLIWCTARENARIRHSPGSPPPSRALKTPEPDRQTGPARFPAPDHLIIELEPLADKVVPLMGGSRALAAFRKP